MGEATLRKMRCRQEIRRGVTGVPPAFRDSLLQVDEVLFLPSPSLWKANKYVTCKENHRDGLLHDMVAQAIHKFCHGQAQASGNMAQCVTRHTGHPGHHILGKMQPKPQPSHEKLTGFYSFHRSQPFQVLT